MKSEVLMSHVVADVHHDEHWILWSDDEVGGPHVTCCRRGKSDWCPYKEKAE